MGVARHRPDELSRPYRGPRRGEAGFTLIEVLIALFVLAVGILGAARLVASSEASTLDAELQQIATEEAEQAVEDVHSLDYAAVGHGTAGLPNGGQPYEAPDAPAAEDIVELSTGAGVVPSRTFEVERGGGKPPVTGTIETFVTWRDEECSLLDLSTIPGITTLRNRLSDLQTQLSPLVGTTVTTGLIESTESQLTTTLINAIPSGQRPTYLSLKAELQALGPLLETTSTQATRVQDLLDSLNGEIDLCDLEVADLSGLQALLEVDSSLLSDLTNGLVTVNSTLTALSGPLNTLTGYIASLGELVCGLLPTPNICGTVSSLVGPAESAVNPSSGPKPATIAGNVNNILTGIDLDVSSLLKDTTHNTKRITVAVTVDTGREDITPNNTIWLSSVVTDPDAGLIISGGLG